MTHLFLGDNLDHLHVLWHTSFLLNSVSDVEMFLYHTELLLDYENQSMIPECYESLPNYDTSQFVGWRMFKFDTKMEAWTFHQGLVSAGIQAYLGYMTHVPPDEEYFVIASTMPQGSTS